MSPRYLIVVGNPSADSDQLIARVRSRAGLEPAFANSRVAALTNAACRCIPVGESGCILGWLFHRNGPARQVDGMSADEVAAIVGSDGTAMLSSFWGGYVAAIAGSASVRVMRDPSAMLPCYFASRGGFVLFASDAEILVAAGVGIDIDFEEIGRQLYRAFVPSPSTALCNIRELLAGFSLRVPMAIHDQEPCWSPWDHVVDRGDTPDRAAERLKRIVSHCVHAWASTRGRLLLSVSGGLDSSILAACLARSRKDMICLTMFADDPAGDERSFARALCDHLGLQLIERPYRLEDIDITEPLAPHLPRPRDRTQANAYERVHLKVAAEFGADFFMTGNGGDNVLGYSQSAVPVADRYLTEGIGQEMFRSLLDVCRQTGCSIFDALGQAWRLTRGSPAHRIQPNPLFLHPHFVVGLRPAELHHAWLDAPVGALPGKAVHISSILRVQPNLEADRGYHLPVLSPLMSQPVVECCLEIPSWEWRAGGRDRSLARSAFAADLPQAVLNRRVKGTPSRFAARLLDHFRKAIRERLLDGRLAANRIIDAAAVEQLLAGEGPVPDLERVRILEFVNAEAWIDRWAARRQAPEPGEANIRSGEHGLPCFSSGPIP
jgi:asparagine synthase (glutamine-hydrolysing)